MIPTPGRPRVVRMDHIGDAAAAMHEARVSEGGVRIMGKKAVFRVVSVTGISVRAASILKQEMLARGGEVAVSRDVYEVKGEGADCLLMGTLGQFERLLPKLKMQPFGLSRLADSLGAALRNYDTPQPAAPPGIDLSGGPLLMGVVNVTPDSFSDGGDFSDTAAAVKAGLEMAAQGAAFVDVGGESTRPGSDPVSPEDEAARVIPVVEALAAELPGRVSVDTYKSRLAAQALERGAYMINDVSALRMDREMVAVVRDADCPVVLMHMLGEPKTMQKEPQYSDVVDDVYEFFVERLNWAVDSGLKEENLLVDPGIGFGKTTAHNLQILRNLRTFRSLGRPLVVGTSRKRFLGEILGIDDPKGRDPATAVTTALAVTEGAHILRAHGVGLNLDAIRVVQAILGSRG